MDASGGPVFQSPATEDETVARKRSRRVSFADTTAVHVFDRDEDFETPPEERPSSPSPSPGRPLASDAAEGDETEGEEEFVRPPFGFLGDVDLGSASPASAAGSFSSFDGDGNFFGVVSTSFIQPPGRPSDSGMSEDDYHDQTLDSRTFSMHFNNLIPLDDSSAHSAGSLRIPDSQCATPLKELKGSESVKSSCGQGGLTDMSLCAENSERYDYTKMSPTLNNLLQEVQEPESPKDGTNFEMADHALALPSSETEHGEDKSYIDNGLSSDELVTVSSLEEHSTMCNPVCSDSDSIQEDNAMIVDIHDKSQISLQENWNDNLIPVHPHVKTTVKTAVLLSPAPPYGSFMGNIDLQPPVLDQPLSKDEPPGANRVASACILSSAVPTFSMRDAEQHHQQNQIMNLETVLHTPRTLVQPLATTQGSISSLRSKRQQLFSPNPHSTSNAVEQEACSLGSEFMKGKKISALNHVLKLRLHESPVTHNRHLPILERNELVHEPHNTFSKAEDRDSTVSVSSYSVTPQQLKKTVQVSVLGAPPRQELNEVKDTFCNALALDSLPNHDHSSHMDLDGSGKKRSTEENVSAEHLLPEKRAKGPRSPITSRKQLPCVSLSSQMAEENQSEAHDSGHSSGDDCKKVVLTVSNSMKQMRICPTSISELNPQQLDMFGDMLGKIHVARKYKRLSAAVRIQDSGLAEARFLHDKLLHEKTKLQINCVKLDKLRNKAQLCQVGIQECSYLKSKISQLRRSTAGSTQVKGGPLDAATSVNASDRQEGHARIAEKKVVLSMLQQKVEKLKSSLEHFCNIKGDIGEVVRVAEEQLEMRNQRQIISQQASLWTLNDIVKRENKRDVILNYRNLLFQRIILNISDMSTIFVNNSLMGTKIEQAFPNLNASVAFNFVFKAEENLRLSDLRSLQKKTMETSLLLGNLIDVLDEIKDAKWELLNLTSADFGVDSQTGQLIFSLRFMSYKSAKRVAFTIDMTDLSRAVYPAEPSELPIKVCQAQTTLSQPSLDTLVASIRDLQPGRVMILRLCRMVSGLVNTLPG
uniref:Uncharacterized protein n=1 Tax=Avena sativa TaxID=4498 RepID=A0ACD5WTD0_AVESA